MTAIALLTDFGLQDPYVGILKGVMMGIAPQARLIDISHAVPPGDIRWGAWQLWSAHAYFPAGTVFLAVVDPGVGSSRRPMALAAGGQYFVGPDNGLLSWVAGTSCQRVVLDRPCWHLPVVSQSFHGRDIFAPVAARLAAGMALSELGSAVDAMHDLPWPEVEVTTSALIGEVLLWDHFGNLITNLRGEQLVHWAGVKSLRFEVGGQVVDGLSSCYAEVSPQALLAIIGSTGLLEISLRDGSARQKLGAEVGWRVFVSAT